MAKAVVNAAQDKGLIHEEFHSKVEYIVAHGISSKINDQKVVVGSYHFVFEDEESQIPEGMEEKFQELPSEYSHLYMAIEGKLAAVICIEDPLREEAPQIIKNLKAAGISKVVMMTGDSDRTAKAIAKTSRRGRILLGSIAGRQGKLRGAGKSRRTKSHHDRRRNQRFTGTVRSRHRNRNQRRRRDRPRDRRRDHEWRRLERNRNTEAD